MKYKYNSILIILICIIATSCNSDDDITPSDISNISSTPGPGYIKLEWECPDNATIYYTKVKYFDHLEQRMMWRLSSTDTIQIPNTRAKFGEYDFSIETFSRTNTGSGFVHTIKATSGIAPTTEVVSQIKLTDDQLSTNAQSQSEGPIKNLVDGNNETFFHSTWADPVPAKPHWIQINLKNELQDFRFQYAPRNNGGNKPTDFDLLGSNDGKEWFLIKNFTKEADNLPVTATDEYKSPTIRSPHPFLFLRYSVNETNSETVYWSMSEFRLYTVEVTDPESETSTDVE